jgi:hypothetical protein
MAGTPASQYELRIWQVVAAVSTFGWAITLLYLWRRRNPKSGDTAPAAHTLSEKQAFDALLKACDAGNAAGARAAVIAWTATIMPGSAAVSLAQVAQRLGDEEFGRRLEELDASLYRPGNAGWSGTALAASAHRVRSDVIGARAAKREQPIQLYPSTV